MKGAGLKGGLPSNQQQSNNNKLFLLCWFERCAAVCLSKLLWLSAFVAPAHIDADIENTNTFSIQFILFIVNYNTHTHTHIV